jgi:hypothetical protein
MAINDVLRLQGDYLIVTRSNPANGKSSGGVLTLDVGEGVSGVTTGTVIVKGNLQVNGNVLFGSVINEEVENVRITDNEITLNAGEPSLATYGGISSPAAGGLAGIKISRGRNKLDQDQYAAFLSWNDNESWQGTGAIANIQGLWEFRLGKTGRPQYSGIKINAIRIDEASASTAGTGAGQGPRLNLFGSDNPTAVLSVSGTNNYAARVTDKDDIPNKEYVDSLLVAEQAEAQMVRIGKSYLTLTDTSVDGVPSSIIGILNGDPENYDTERRNPTTGTVVMKLTTAAAQFAGIQLVGNSIYPVGSNQDLRLEANGTGQIILGRPLIFSEGNEPEPGVGETGLYVGPSSGGGTGVYFKKADTLGNITQDEFVSRKKALVFSIIFS